MDFSLFDATQEVGSGPAAGAGALAAAATAAAAAPVPVPAGAAAGQTDVGSRSFKFDEPRPASAIFAAPQLPSNDGSAAALLGVQQQQQEQLQQTSPFASRAGALGSDPTDMV